MPENNSTPVRDPQAENWQFSRQINVSVLVQLVLLAGLIIGSWVNLQRQLDLLQHDVTILLESQQRFEQKLVALSEKSLSHEYRLIALEKLILGADIPEQHFAR